MKLIVGLGNPGKKYKDTRHNAGFMTVEALATAKGATWAGDSTHHAEVAKLQLDGETVLLAKPDTFMNASGEAVQSLASYYKVEPKNILIIQDEMDLSPGTLAFIGKGSTAGHNGIASIQEQLGRDDLPRLRIGIGRPTSPITKEDWALGTMEDATRETTVRATEAIMDWVTNDLDKAMTVWNRKPTS